MLKYLACVGLLIGCNSDQSPNPALLNSVYRGPYVKATVHYEMICNEDVSDPSDPGGETMIVIRKLKGGNLYLFVPAVEVEYLEKMCGQAKSGQKKLRRFGEK